MTDNDAVPDDVDVRGLGTEPDVDDDATIDPEPVPFKYDITSRGADYPVDGLVKRIRGGGLKIPGFQRQYVWKKRQADRFIESLLLGLPVPGIFLADDPDSGRLVLDGQQRLRTLQYFYDNRWGARSRFALSYVQEQFRGLTYETLDPPDRDRLDDYEIHATIVKQNQPSEDQSSVFFVFERINSGGTPLAEQEIRSALYQGPLNDLLVDLNADERWRRVFGKPSPRLKDQELILRFLALHYERQLYKRPMKDFLNKFMGRHRRLRGVTAEDMRAVFVGTIDVIDKALGTGAFRPKAAVNAAVFDSTMVGVSTRLSRGPITDPSTVTLAYFELLRDEEYVTAYTRATADEDRLATRIDLAISAFSGAV